MTNCNVRLSVTQAGLTNGFIIYSWRVPEPDLPLYNDHTQKIDQPDGAQVRRGYKNASLTWNGLGRAQARTLMDIVIQAQAQSSGLIYATINRAWGGYGGGNDWIDISAFPRLPEHNPIERTSAKQIDTFTVFLNNITIINDPASGV